MAMQVGTYTVKRNVGALAMAIAFLACNSTASVGETMTSLKDAKIGPGSQAPDFSLTASDGKSVTLSSFRGKSVVVLFFYPKNGTAVCTKEACLFRDSYDEFAENGATVLGISSDDVQSHLQFAQDNSLQFILLSDPDGSVRKQYQIKSTLGIIPGRETFVIDKQGVIRHSFQSQLNAQKHVTEALDWVKKLTKLSD